MELLIAIGILAVGGAMVAALFPTAVKENTFSYNDTLGSLICNNALATIKAIYSHGSTAPDGITNSANPRYLQQHPDASSHEFRMPRIDSKCGYIGKPAHYPVNDASDKTGFYFLAWQNRNLNDYPLNDYTFVIVSYRKQSQEVIFVPMVGGTKDEAGTETRTDTLIVGEDEAKQCPVNALVIIDSVESSNIFQRGEYARIVRKINSGNQTHLVLDHKLQTPENLSKVRFWIFGEWNANASKMVLRSPVLSVLVARTSLRQN